MVIVLLEELLDVFDCTFKCYLHGLLIGEAVPNDVKKKFFKADVNRTVLVDGK